MAVCPLDRTGKKCNTECAWWRKDAEKCVIHFLYGNTDSTLSEISEVLNKILEKLDQIKIAEPKRKPGRPPGRKNKTKISKKK